MKRILMMVLCAALCFQMTACELNVKSPQKDKWVDYSEAILSNDEWEEIDRILMDMR